MNLSFDILWIEDDYDFYDSWNETINEFILKQNLKPNIKYKKTISDKEIKEIDNQYDLILIDYNLSNNNDEKYGTQIIQMIRKKSLLPDIVFYSSINSIEDIITKETQENRTSVISLLQNGIYYTKSDSGSFVGTIEQVITKILLREQKINGFKGMLLSSVSEYERMVNEILDKCKDRLDNEQKTILKEYIVTNVLNEQSKTLSDTIDDFCKAECDESLSMLFDPKNRCLDHFKRTKIMKKAIAILFEYDFMLDDYGKFISLRNCLSHVSTKVLNENNNLVLELSGGEKRQFDSAFVVETRKKICDWDDEFDKIICLFNDKN